MGIGSDFVFASILDSYQLVDDRVDGQTCGRVDIQFARDVFTMGDDRMYRNAQLIRYLFVAESID
jgi:hypothetical protein